MKKEGDESEEANSIYTGLDLQGGVKLAHYHNMISMHLVCKTFVEYHNTPRAPVSYQI